MASTDLQSPDTYSGSEKRACAAEHCPLERLWRASADHFALTNEREINWSYRCPRCRRFKRRKFFGKMNELALTVEMTVNAKRN